MAKFFNADSNSTSGMYKFGDVESGAMMTVNFKTMPYSNNKYNFSEPFLVYDMVAEVTHEGNVFTETLSPRRILSKPKQSSCHGIELNSKLRYIHIFISI